MTCRTPAPSTHALGLKCAASFWKCRTPAHSQHLCQLAPLPPERAQQAAARMLGAAACVLITPHSFPAPMPPPLCVHQNAFSTLAARPQVGRGHRSNQWPWNICFASSTASRSVTGRCADVQCCLHCLISVLCVSAELALQKLCAWRCEVKRHHIDICRAQTHAQARHHMHLMLSSYLRYTRRTPLQGICASHVHVVAMACVHMKKYSCHSLATLAASGRAH